MVQDLWAGVDVGGRRKGFHVAVIDGERLIDVNSFHDPVDVAASLSRQGPSLVGVDSPLSLAPDGERSRPGERAFAAAGICSIRYTPDRSGLAANPEYYEWVEQGFRLYDELRKVGVPVIECFPTASWTRWLGRRGNARRSEWTTAALRARGMADVPKVLSQDARDAIAAALTARAHAAGETERFGDIVVPVAQRSSLAVSEVNRRFVIQGGREITSIYDWYCLAPPKQGSVQWQAGRSAMESARAWLRIGKPAVPEEIAALLESRPETSGFQALLAIPELVTELDGFRGEHRNHDLVVVGEAGGRRTLIGIEAKADEPFGSATVAEHLAKGRTVSGSRIPDRIFGLVEGLFGPDGIVGDRVRPDIGELRYQLLAAIAGTLIEARRRWADQAVFIVHEFLSKDHRERGYRGTRQNRVDENAAALSALAIACGIQLSTGKLCGPFLARGNDRTPAGLPLFLGKATVTLDPYG